MRICKECGFLDELLTSEFCPSCKNEYYKRCKKSAWHKYDETVKKTKTEEIKKCIWCGDLQDFSDCYGGCD